MTVAAVVTNETEAYGLTLWAWQFAWARQQDVLVLALDETGELAGKVDAAAVLAQSRHEAGEGVEDDRKPELPTVESTSLSSKADADAIFEKLRNASVELLLLCKQRKTRATTPDDERLRRLFLEASCDTMLIRLPREGKVQRGHDCQRVLVPASGGPHSAEALRWAVALTRQSGGSMDALYVQPDVGDASNAVGQAMAESILSKALGKDVHGTRPVCMVGGDFRKAVAEAVETESNAGEDRGYDLVLVGASDKWSMRKLLFSAVPDKLVNEPDGPAVAVMHQGASMTKRAGDWLAGWVSRVAPQMSREDRVTLVSRVQGSSRFDFDFLMLICLSTLIAAMGLRLNSAAVVIGAMLVAPLMTPLVGCGLALAQGNAVLIRHAIKAVAMGFILAVAIGWVLGLGLRLTGVDTATEEMLARGSPGLLDLGVAFFSGMAAAYATARPNLSGALPGVAIAAALVPPIATCGLALAIAEDQLALGSGLLFATNIVAIILGAAISLWALGVRPDHSHGGLGRWVKPTLGGLGLAGLVLACLLWVGTHRGAVPKPLPEEARAAIERILDESDAAWIDGRLREADEGVTLELTVQAEAGVSEAVVQRLANTAERVLGRPCVVRVQTNLIREVSSE